MLPAAPGRVRGEAGLCWEGLAVVQQGEDASGRPGRTGQGWISALLPPHPQQGAPVS